MFKVQKSGAISDVWLWKIKQVCLNSRTARDRFITSPHPAPSLSGYVFSNFIRYHVIILMQTLNTAGRKFTQSHQISIGDNALRPALKWRNKMATIYWPFIWQCKEVGASSELRSCESRGGRPGFPVPDSPYGLCGRKATLNLNSELGSCVKVDVAVLGSPSLIDLMVDPVPSKPCGFCGR